MTPILMGWQDSFNQHKKIIDEQHRAIITTVNSIYYLHTKADERNLIKHVMYLYSQLQLHFQTEMHILRQHESPQLASYEKGADAFLDSLLNLCDTYTDESQTQQLFEQFKHWWESHLELHKEITPYLFDWEGEFCRVVASA